MINYFWLLEVLILDRYFIIILNDWLKLFGKIQNIQKLNNEKNIYF